MPPVVEVLFVWVPIILSIGFVSWYLRRRVREGLTLLGALTDKNVMLVVLYSGALLAIYLSTFHFFYTGLWPVESHSNYIKNDLDFTTS